jgi:hypothetical protein
MSGLTRFCTQCGNALEQDNRYCGSCGSPTRAVPGAPAELVSAATGRAPETAKVDIHPTGPMSLWERVYGEGEAAERTLAPAGAEPSPAQRVRSEDNGLAVTALILGIAGFVLPILAPFALWLGLNAHNNAMNSAHPSFGRGKGMAIAGAVLGGIMTALLAVAFFIAINA